MSGFANVHLVSCIQEVLRSLDERDNYEEMYPTHCELCEGWGFVYECPEQLIEACSHISDLDSVKVYCSCVLGNTCPRCGLNGCLDDNYCVECEFVLGETKGKPALHKCICPKG